jgi:hypothetical protein
MNVGLCLWDPFCEPMLFVETPIHYELHAWDDKEAMQ